MEEKKSGFSAKLFLVGVGLVFLGYAAYKTGFVDLLADIPKLQLWFEELGTVGYLIYIALYVLVAICMLPASAMTIAAGITFGSVFGGFLSLVGATLGASVAFLIAKYVVRDAIKNKFDGNAIFKKIEDGVRTNGTSFLILTRLVPVFPYNVQNYAYGVTSMNVGTFALVSFITMAPGSFIYAYMAGEIVSEGFSVKLMIQFAVAGIILFLVSLIPKYIAKKKGIKIN